MICGRCGTYMADDVLTCENCGTLLSDGSPRLRETGVRAIRQGRLGSIPPSLSDMPRDDVPEYGDYDMSPLPLEQERPARRKTAPKGLSSFASRPTTRRGVPVNPRGRAQGLNARHVKTHVVKRHPINWMLLGMIGIVLVIGAVSGYIFYMRGTDAGQRATARRIITTVDGPYLELARSKDDLHLLEKEAAIEALSDAPAHAYWLIGQEYMDMGDVTTAILCYQVADILDPESYDGLLLLANAYELDANDTQAEEIYQKLLEEIAPSRTEAYSALINMYLDQERNPEAADLMLKAYENTDSETYRLQRKEFIPLVPQVDLAAGRYELEQTVNLVSPQGYDIYYTMGSEDDVPPPKLGVIPEGWNYTEDGTLKILEGTRTLRAICVSGNLVSDPLAVTYTVFYPSPSAPAANLAPNTYDKPRDVSLRPGSKEDEKDYKDGLLTIYYTIDGSLPSEESPVFDGTPIKLPSGRVTLKAIAVNKYGKMSSTREIGYKFNVKPYPMEVYSETDTFIGFTLNSTTAEEFKTRFGAPGSQTETQYLHVDAEAILLEYDWGSAVFILKNSNWTLVRVEMTREMTRGPRSVGIGSSEAEITDAYKDMGQIQSPNGNRGLYYDDPRIGRVTQNADGTRTVQYSCSTMQSNTWILQYHLKNNRVYQIEHYYQP